MNQFYFPEILLLPVIGLIFVNRKIFHSKYNVDDNKFLGRVLVVRLLHIVSWISVASICIGGIVINSYEQGLLAFLTLLFYVPVCAYSLVMFLLGVCVKRNLFIRFQAWLYK